MRKFKIFVASLGISIMLGVVVGVFWTYTQINMIPKFDLENSKAVETINTPSVAPVDNFPEQSSFLIFSVGSQGLGDGDGERLGIGNSRARMGDGLTDSIMLVLMNKSNRKISIISINRDMLIESTGRRINNAYNSGGITAFLDQIEELTGIRPEHQIKMNFAAFADMTDAIGGIDINIPNAVYDKYAKLNISYPGCVHLDGPNALAFARSRHWAILNSNGNYVADATSSDYGRIERQQSIVRTMIKKLIGPQIVSTFPAIISAAKSNITFDEGLNSNTLLGLANTWKSGVNQITASTLPSHGVMLNGASVTLPEVQGIYETIYKVAKKIDFRLPTNWTGNSYVDQTTLDTQILTESSIKEFANNKAWKPDNGLGLGGTQFSSCENGHLPN